MPKFPMCVYSRVVLGSAVREVLVLFPTEWHRAGCDGDECADVSVVVRTMKGVQADASGGI